MNTKATLSQCVISASSSLHFKAVLNQRLDWGDCIQSQATLLSQICQIKSFSTLGIKMVLSKNNSKISLKNVQLPYLIILNVLLFMRSQYLKTINFKKNILKLFSSLYILLVFALVLHLLL